MAFEKARIYFNNLFRAARLGNDGTSYATCAEAVADPDDPNKVRGEISPADDIPNLSDLEGAGVVFDTTKNEYRIVDSEALMRRLATVLLLPRGYDASASVVVGSYLYCAHKVDPGVVSKIDLTSWEIVALLPLASGENSALSITASPDAQYLFVGCSTAPGVVVKIAISGFPVSQRGPSRRAKASSTRLSQTAVTYMPAVGSPLAR